MKDSGIYCKDHLPKDEDGGTPVWMCLPCWINGDDYCPHDDDDHLYNKDVPCEECGQTPSVAVSMYP